MWEFWACENFDQVAMGMFVLYEYTYITRALLIYIEYWGYIVESCPIQRLLCSHRKLNKLTGWRRLIGSPKLQIIFHKRATNYRSLLRKMTYKDKGSYESSPPCSVGVKRIVQCILSYVHIYQWYLCNIYIYSKWTRFYNVYWVTCISMIHV